MTKSFDFTVLEPSGTTYEGMAFNADKYTEEQAIDKYIDEMELNIDRNAIIAKEGYMRYVNHFPDSLKQFYEIAEENDSGYVTCDKGKGAFKVWIVDRIAFDL